MATDDKKQPEFDEALEGLARDDEQSDSDRAALEQLADRVEEPGLQDRILERYAAFGRELLSDTIPDRLDPRVAKRLESTLGDVSGVRVHTGKVATEAARAMSARAFAIGDADVFVDQAEYRPGTTSGAALLAHEVAHTRDAGTGFALSREAPGAGERSEREAFAHAIEESYVAAEEGGQEQLQPAPAEAANQKKPKIDKFELEDRVWGILQDRAKKARRRSGR